MYNGLKPHHQGPNSFGYLKEAKYVLLVCLRSKDVEIWWYIDSRYSRHMIGDRNMCTKLEENDYGEVSFGDNK